jgi:flagellar biosynthetic protein FliQ
MTTDIAVQIARQGMLVAMLLAAPMLFSGLIVGLIISVLQAVTQVNEMTLSFIPKILAVFLSFILFLPWILRTIMDFTVNLFSNLPTYGL